eukprot:scaffold461_cov321-Pavlova_lutheri.AAC.55
MGTWEPTETDGTAASDDGWNARSFAETSARFVRNLTLNAQGTSRTLELHVLRSQTHGQGSERPTQVKTRRAR